MTIILRCILIILEALVGAYFLSSSIKYFKEGKYFFFAFDMMVTLLYAASVIKHSLF